MPARLLLTLTTLIVLALPASASAITGGKAATQPYPYMAALTDGKGEWAGCGASLVRPDWVLTAAHCTEDVKVSDLGVRVGTHDISSTSNGEFIPAADVIIHERWGDEENTSIYSFDVSLIKLARPATQATPIRIASPAERDAWAPEKIATVTGWGGTFYPGIGGLNTTEEQLMEVQVPIVSDDTCSSYTYGLGDVSDFTFGEFDPETMVCAGNDTGGADSCSGDSGGPLVVPNASGSLVQVGVVSWGFGCGYPFNYGVYSRIADDPLYTWIQSRLPAETTTTTTTSETTTTRSTDTAPAAQPAPAQPATTSTSSTTSASSTTASSVARPNAAQRRAIGRAYRRCTAKAKKIKSTSRRRRATKRCAAKRRAALRRLTVRTRPAVG